MSNRRLQELIKTHNLPVLRLITSFANRKKLDRLDDPRLPKQIAELAGREDVIEKIFFQRHYPGGHMKSIG